MNVSTLEGLYELGKSLALQGNLHGADEKLEEVIQTIASGGFADSKKVKGLLYKAYKMRLDLNVDHPEIRDDIRVAILHIFGEDKDFGVAALWDLAQYYKILNDSVRHMDALDQLQTRFPNNPYQLEIALELGLVSQHVKKDVREAIRQYVAFLNQAKADHPNIGVAAVNLASCYNAINQPDRAQNILKKYMKIG